MSESGAFLPGYALFDEVVGVALAFVIVCRDVESGMGWYPFATFLGVLFRGQERCVSDNKPGLVIMVHVSTLGGASRKRFHIM